MERVLATELRSKSPALGVLPRRYATESSNFGRRNLAKRHVAGGQIRSAAGHNFSSVAIYEENLEGQPAPDTEFPEDTSEAIPLDVERVEVPMSDSATGGTQTGSTRCDTATGKVITATLNTNECTKDCSTKHEDKHAADIAPCCSKAGEASKAATTDSDKAGIQTKFDNWMLSNKPFLECRAYAVSVSCGDARHKKANCEKESYGKCCKPLVWYIRTAKIEGEAACNHADKNLSDCPFS